MNYRISPMLLLIVTIAVIMSGCAGQDEQETPAAASATVVPTQAPEAIPPTAAPPTATPLTEPVFRLARVDSLAILTEADDPTQVGVRLRGALSNGCARIDDIITELEGDVFTIVVIEGQDPPALDHECTEAEVPFDETVDLIGLAPGAYNVSAHGLSGTFTIEATDLPAEQTLEPALTSLTGQVWHDLCIGSGNSEGEPGDGCVVTADNGFMANGIFENEPGIEGLQIGLAAGGCDAPATVFTFTDAGGGYTFADLAPGDYCVSVDPADEQNQEILLAGLWTSPEGGQAQQVISIADEAPLSGVDFGWDYDYLPLAEVDLATCQNSFALVEDLNIPDDTQFAPDQPFTKRWLLRNNGTCPWFTDYSVVFVGGDQLSAPDSRALGQAIVPGQRVEVAIDMISPLEPGTYRSNWQIADSSGEPFGMDGIIEDAFWLRIVVSEDASPVTTPSTDSGTIGGVVWDDLCLNSDPGSGCIEFPEDSGIYIADGSFGPTENSLSEITISLASLSCPADGSLPPAERILTTAQSDEDGLYRFQDLDSGMYCIFMDALSEENVDFLIPGNWTWPATGVGRYTFFLDPGEQALDLDFGWDYAD